jgi:hypothetical protein
MNKEKLKKELKLFVALVLVVITCYFLFCQEGITGAVAGIDGAEIEANVFEELEEKGKVSVIVELKEGTVSEDLPGKKADIEERQEEVLEKLNLEETEIFFGLLTEEKDFELNHKYSTVNAFSGEVTEKGLEKLERNTQVKRIYFNKVLHPLLDASIPQINADKVWDYVVNNISIKGSGETVCIIDTGIDNDHSAFTGRIVGQHCYCRAVDYGSGGCCPNNAAEDTNAEDGHGHGTHCAGIAAGDYDVYKGAAPEADIVAIKVCDNSGNCNSDDVIAAIEWCTNNASKYNISVISISLGGDGPYNTYCDNNSYGIAPAIDSAAANGINVVIAVGNNGWTNGISSPSCVESATPAGAVDSSDGIVFNRGNILDLLAPGESITAPFKGGGTTTFSGTSMSTPHLAGTIALLKQYWRLAYGLDLMPQEVEEKLRITGKVVDDMGGSGRNYSRVDILKAVQPFIEFTEDSVADETIQVENSAFVDVVSDVDLVMVWLEWNYNGTVENITMNGSEKEFYFNVTNLSFGDHTYKVFGSNVVGIIGESEVKSFEIDRAEEEEVDAVLTNITITFNYPLGDFVKENFNLNISILIDNRTLENSFYNITNFSDVVMQENSMLDIDNSSFEWLELINISELADGNYSIIVSVVDVENNSAAEESNFVIDRVEPSQFGFEIVPEVVYTDSVVVFYVNVTDENLNRVLIEGSWTGNATNYTMNLSEEERFNYTLIGDLGNQELVEYKFCSFDLAENSGCSESFNFIVQNKAPIVSLITPADGTVVEAGSTVQFNNSAEDFDGDELSYVWIFDGIDMAGHEVEKQFDDTGNFLVVLNVSDGYDFVLTNISLFVNDTRPPENQLTGFDEVVYIDDEEQEVEATFFDFSGISEVNLYFKNSTKEGSSNNDYKSITCSWGWGEIDFGEHDFVIEAIDNFSKKHSKNWTYSFSVIGCGDNVINGNEECDGSELDGETCAGIGYDSGELICSDCIFDASGCSIENDDSDDSSNDDSSSSVSGGDSGSSGAGGSGGASPICSVGAIRCDGLTQYKECLAFGTTNKWSETRNVPAGKECIFGDLSLVEDESVKEFAEDVTEMEVAGIKERAAPKEPKTSGTSLTGRAVSFLKEVPELDFETKILIGLSFLIVVLLVLYSFFNKKSRNKRKYKKTFKKGGDFGREDEKKQPSLEKERPNEMEMAEKEDQEGQTKKESTI